DRLLIGTNRLQRLPLRLENNTHIVRGDVVGLVELDRDLVLLPSLLREAAQGEEVAKVVSQGGGVRTRLDELLLFPNPIVQGIAGDQVSLIERLFRRGRRSLRVRLLAEERAGQRHHGHHSHRFPHRYPSFPVDPPPAPPRRATSLIRPSRSARSNSTS